MGRYLVLVFGLFVSGCAGRHFSVAPIENPGERLGRLISDVDQTISADAGYHVGSGSPLHRALVNRLNDDQSVLENSATTDVISRANGAAAREVFDAHADICPRNWEAVCPDGWRGFGGHVCEAPGSYGGACAAIQSFAGWAALDKHTYSEACSAPWPCKDECAIGRDYDECPVGWKDVGGGTCQASGPLQNSCPAIYNFKDAGNVQMQNLAATCNMSWPCRVQCEEDYTQSCPEGWKETPPASGVCLAPWTYSGACPFSVNTTGMDDRQKNVFAAECFVAFPCAHADSRRRGRLVGTEEGRTGPVDAYFDIILHQPTS